MIWSNEKIKLFNADCFDIFPQIADKSVDLILADLPYGTTACKWDTILPFDKLWQAYERIIKDNGAIVLTASQPFTSALVMSNPKMFKYELIFEKPNPSNPLLAQKRVMSFHENILVFYKKQPVFFSQKVKRLDKNKRNNTCKHISRPDVIGNNPIREMKSTGELKHPSSVLKFNRESGFHPTQKPVSLMEFILKTYTNEGDLVLDNTFGSGTTAVACQNLNRQFVGMEKEKKYFDIAVQRLTA